MDWKRIQIPASGKLFKAHNFTFMFQGVNYTLEVDEYHDGSCTGHGEHSTDKSYIIDSVNAKSVEECLSSLLKKIQTRSGGK